MDGGVAATGEFGGGELEVDGGGELKVDGGVAATEEFGGGELELDGGLAAAPDSKGGDVPDITLPSISITFYHSYQNKHHYIYLLIFHITYNKSNQNPQCTKLN